MQRIVEGWLADGTLSIDGILAEMGNFEKATDSLITEEGAAHRFHKELAVVYRAKLRDAIGTKDTPNEQRNLVRAEIIAQTMLNMYSPEEITFWYANPQFPEETDGSHHHNAKGKIKVESLVEATAHLQKSLGLYKETGYRIHPDQVRSIFDQIIRQIVKMDISEHIRKMRSLYQVNGKEAQFIDRVLTIKHETDYALACTENVRYLLGTLVNIRRFHKTYNPRFIGKSYHDAKAESRLAAERVLLDVEILGTAIERYLVSKGVTLPPSVARSATPLPPYSPLTTPNQ